MLKEYLAVTKPIPRRDRDGLHKRRGIWHYKLKVGGRWKEVSTRTTKYREAVKARQEALQAQKEGRLPKEKAKWLFRMTADKWLEDRRGRVAPKTFSTEKERLVPLLSVFGSQRLREIDADSVKAYQSRRLSEASNKTINLETAVLRMILRSAKLWGRISEDFKPLPKKKRGPGRALSPKEEAALFEAASSNPRWDLAFYAALISANTTCRGCELRGLRLGDVDLLERKCLFRRS